MTTEFSLDVTGNSMLRVLNVNCNGIRIRYKCLQFEELPPANRIGAAVVAETHLRRAELERAHLRYYAVITEY